MKTLLLLPFKILWFLIKLPFKILGFILKNLRFGNSFAPQQRYRR